MKQNTLLMKRIHEGDDAKGGASSLVAKIENSAVWKNSKDYTLEVNKQILFATKRVRNYLSTTKQIGILSRVHVHQTLIYSTHHQFSLEKA